MKFLRDLPIPSDRYQQFLKDGWENPTLLAVLSSNELIKYFNLPQSDEIVSMLDENVGKLRIKENILHKWNELLSSQSWVLTTGSQKINDMLDGNGLQSKCLTLFYGKFRTGKSQLAHQGCINTYIQFREELPLKVALFIDTEGTFRPERITQMAQAKDLPVSDVLQHISTIKISSLSEFDLLLSKLDELLNAEGIRFVVIDSLTNFYREEMAKNTKTPHKVTENLAKNLAVLKDLAEKYNIPIMCTSQVTSTFSKTYFFNVIPVMAHTLNIYIKQWILLAEDENITALQENTGRRNAHLINGQNKKEQNAQFIILDDGILDYFA